MKHSILFSLFLLSGWISNAQGILGNNVKAQLVKDWELAKILTKQILGYNAG